MTARVALRAIVAIGLVVGCLGFGVPTVAGVRWSQTLHTLSTVPASALGSLVLLWALGLVVHSVALTAAMPGLTVRRALTLSLTGSSIANVLPVGGAAGIALNYRMVREWGFRRSDFTVYTLLANVWIVAAKVLVPVVAAVALLVAPVPGVSAIRPLLVIAALVIAGLALALGIALLLLRRRRTSETALTARRVVAAHWPRLTGATLAYTALLGVLLWCCLHVTGTTLGLSALLLAVAVERTSTLANLTPGGLGVVELGLVGVLVATGGASAPVVAGVLLYRALTFGLEIPVGGLWLVGWWASHHRPLRRTAAVA